MNQPVDDVIRGLNEARFAAAIGDTPSSRAIGLGWLALRDLAAASAALLDALDAWDHNPDTATAAAIDLARHNLRTTLDHAPSTDRTTP